ncbi:integrase [Comamonas thiooxydans]|uniref:Integrase n=1 Tax=Comamonas thiooxydans TaxID=363952 RepID=A0A0E3CB36_9BURK|nr:helix-turn-helix domain-containing protein [Comamonas thiooxydans]KGH04445.1 integrase [Comamonas thiooxydans]KGH10048.1 integrase [Comamonas thiooxydans]KGH18292.1 integrase [Comamonas thiooxydans]
MQHNDRHWRKECWHEAKTADWCTQAQKALMWDRWKAGDTLHKIGKLLDRPHTSIHTILSATGGIRPAARHRSRLALTMPEREEISRALAAGESIRCVASRFK